MTEHRTEKESSRLWDETRQALGINIFTVEHDPWLKEWRHENDRINAEMEAKRQKADAKEEKSPW